MLDLDKSVLVITGCIMPPSDLLAGKMICGAGGGGFLQVVLKKGVEKSDLQVRLNSVFSDTDIGVWDATLV